jgi:hypothetical protein
MKIAASSASFAAALAAGELTQLEWLDLCASELEADGVVFELAHFPRLDAEYLAQLKKLAVDVGLTVAALASGGALSGDPLGPLETAEALGAPLLLATAPAGDGAPGWAQLVAHAAAAAAEGKRRNVTVAVRDVPGTLCPDAAALRQLAKEVDSAWLRFAPEPSALRDLDAPEAILEKSPIAVHRIANVARFASAGDEEGERLVSVLQRFRGFVVLERDRAGAPDALHGAFERFRALRCGALCAPERDNNHTAVCMPG